MKITPRMIAQRFLVPQFLASLYYTFKFRCAVSHKAEVELSRHITFGKGVVVASFAKIKASYGPLVVGRKSAFAVGCFVDASTAGIRIGNHCKFGPNVTISATSYVYDRTDVPFAEQGFTSKGITVGNNVWVGAGTTILDGTVVGDNTIVGANSVLWGELPPNVVLQGNPARVIKKLSESS